MRGWAVVTDAGTPAGEPGYLLDNAQAEARRRFAGLEASFDALTRQHLAARGVRPGWRCLEVGAGSGSVARWLAGQVGPYGHVLATDIDTRWTDPGEFPNLDVAQHDIAADPMPADGFDLIHARLVLVHLPARDQVLARLAAALPRPGHQRGASVREGRPGTGRRAAPAGRRHHLPSHAAAPAAGWDWPRWAPAGTW